MIKNDRQFSYSKRKLKGLEAGLNLIKSRYAGKPNKAKLLSQGYHEHIAQIREEMAEYERIKSSSIPSALRAQTPDELRRRMIELRLLRGLTQADLARKVGCKQSDISRLEKGGYKGYSLATLNKIARALNSRLEICFRPESAPKRAASQS
jgi:DNA-binding XRE family transcriptional regulator